MKITIPYLMNKRTLPLSLPDDGTVTVAEPNDVALVSDVPAMLKAALDSPLDAHGNPSEQSLDAFLKGGKHLLILVNDATRPTPTEDLLFALRNPVKNAGYERDNVTILVATGAHRLPTEPEYHQILGKCYDTIRPRCVAHDSRDDASLINFGATRNGTPILLNRRLFEADRIIITGSVEPHYFAGFTGGRKAFLPAVAGRVTITANHRLALNPNARSLKLDGNPVHEDMMDALSLIKAPVFSFMTVMDKEQRPAAATSGDIIGSFYAAVEIARRVFCVKVPHLYDIVVSVAKFPMDIDLYQSQKAIDNGAGALADGGFLVLVSSCRDGLGDETYAKLLASSSSPADALKRISAEYKLGYHKAAKMATLAARATILTVSELSDELLASMFTVKMPSLQEAVDYARARLAERGIKSPRILILPDGCVTVPDVQQQEAK
jgi:nickel-dependent lactate racemase